MPPMMCCGGGGAVAEVAAVAEVDVEAEKERGTEWKKIIEENLSEKDTPTSVNAIQSAFYKRFPDHKFLVICSQNKQTTSKINLSSGGDGYCHLANEHISCQVASLSA
uniref:Uncharacterized protein n=1 Tax=Ditylenchus dipsaci TaxID=166011 RepID=A0A915DNK2_9BILA